MSRITKQRKREVHKYTSLEARDETGSIHWSTTHFLASKAGGWIVLPIHMARMLPVERDNYRKHLCDDRFTWSVAEHETVVLEPAEMVCDCGAEVVLWDAMTNGCDECGTEYNGSGQKLAPRHQWGWDTGETFYCNCGYCEECV